MTFDINSTYISIWPALLSINFNCFEINNNYLVYDEIQLKKLDIRGKLSFSCKAD